MVLVSCAFCKVSHSITLSGAILCTKMDMNHGSSSMKGPTCKISMLWNWYTVDACFISRQWHIRSKVAFAFSVICVFLLVGLVEGVRRLGREYDRRLIQQARLAAGTTSPPSTTKDSEGFVQSTPRLFTYTPSWKHQILRGLIFGVHFGAAYILMLLAMYYNGYMIFAIILGGTAGFIVFGRDTITLNGPEDSRGAICC
ncbi:hypothetical protein FRC02_011136 [Tulasnella sp. 418]|nr:hypothetical protein FRC02_011136 [Tulasnella sp. 418]